MKHRVLIKVALAVFALTSAGCASKANYSGDIKDEAPVESATGTVGEGGVSQEPSLGELNPEAPPATGGLLDTRRIHFDYDKSVVPEEYLPVLAAHSDYLNRNPGRRVILEGHADERGSNEYNLALGQRRADAVREILLGNGVGAGQIETLSFGEESPVSSGQTEAAWAQNRRVEIRYHNE